MCRVNEHWLALMMGNSRLHWAWFVGDPLQQAWDSNHLPAATVEQLIQRWASGILPKEILPPLLVSQALDTSRQLPLYLASVTPDHAKVWQAYPATKIITLEQVPLLGLYPTLGIDRALAVFGAGETLGYPVLVMDAGTALTFTGANSHYQLVGGAILPGLKLQLQSLAKNTAALPEIQLPTQLPRRWALQVHVECSPVKMHMMKQYHLGRRRKDQLSMNLILQIQEM